MLDSDEIWDDVRPFMNANDDKLFITLEIFTGKEYQEVISQRIN